MKVAMRCTRLLAGLLAATPCLGQSAARADPAAVERATRMYSDGALSDALSAFQQALEGGGNGRGDLVIIYNYLGVLRAGARDREGALAAFRAALSLDPSSRPSADLPPHVRDVFEAALLERAGAAALACAPSVIGSALVGRTLTVRVRVRGDPLGLAAAVRVERDGIRVASARGAAPFELRIPEPGSGASAPPAMTVVLLDRYGSTLDSVAFRTEERGSEPAGPSRSAGSLLTSPWFWTGATLLIAGGVVAGLLVSGQSDDARFGDIEVYR